VKEVHVLLNQAGFQQEYCGETATKNGCGLYLPCLAVLILRFLNYDLFAMISYTTT